MLESDCVSIYFFGDSICFGQGVSLNHTWVMKAAQKIEERLLGMGICSLVQNFSINGNTTRMALERIAYDIQGKDIDILVVQFGMNDCNYWETDKGLPRVSIQAFEANLCEIIERAKICNIKKVMLNTNHPSLRNFEKMKYTDLTYQASNGRYNKVIRKVANSYQKYVVLTDIEQGFYDKVQTGGLASYLLPDLLHLSKNGCELYFDLFYPNLSNAVDCVIAEK